jgi:hypothetical protein
MAKMAGLLGKKGLSQDVKNDALVRQDRQAGAAPDLHFVAPRIWDASGKGLDSRWLSVYRCRFHKQPAGSQAWLDEPEVILRRYTVNEILGKWHHRTQGGSDTRTGYEQPLAVCRPILEAKQFRSRRERWKDPQEWHEA